VLAQRKAQIQRESEVLEQLGSHSYLIAYRYHFTDSIDPNLYAMCHQ